MTIYIALLRGINVGGHNKIIMAQLKSSLEQLALQNIRTYIQSGNIIFESNESEEDLQTKIQEKFHEDFDIFTTVVRYFVQGGVPTCGITADFTY